MVVLLIMQNGGSCSKNKIDAIISGAGLPLNLPGLVKDTKIK